MAFACSGMLRAQFDKFLQFFCIGHFTWTAITGVLHSLSATISVLSQGSVSRALYEEVARTAETTSDNRCVRLMTDARHACRKNSHHSDVVAIGQVTRKVINIQHVTKLDDKSTQRHEVLGTTRLYDEFREKNIKVSFRTLFYYQLLLVSARRLNGAIVNTVRYDRKSVFKDGGRQTGSTYTSASRQDSNSVPTANPTFSGSSN